MVSVQSKGNMGTPDPGFLAAIKDLKEKGEMTKNNCIFLTTKEDYLAEKEKKR